MEDLNAPPAPFVEDGAQADEGDDEERAQPDEGDDEERENGAQPDEGDDEEQENGAQPDENNENVVRGYIVTGSG